MLHMLSLCQTSRYMFIDLYVCMSIHILSLTKIQGLWAYMALGFSGGHACFSF